MKFQSALKEGLTPGNALGWPSFLVMLLWSVLANLFDAMQGAHIDLEKRLQIVLVVHVATWATLWASVAIGLALNRLVKGWSLLAILLTVAAIRGVGAQLLFDAVGVRTVTGMAVRVAFSVLYVGVGIALTALWIHQVRRHNQLLETMFGEQERLYQIKFEAEQKIIEANDRLIKVIQADLLKRVDALHKRSALEALSGLRDAIDQVVRPMSQHLAYSTESWTPEPVKPRRVGVSWLRVISEAFEVSNIQPLGVTIATAALLAPSTVQILSLHKAWILLILVPALQFGFITIFKRACIRLIPRQKRWVQAVFVVFGFMCMGIIAGITAKFVLDSAAAERIYAVPAMLYTTVIGIASVLLMQAQKAMAKVEEQLESTTAEAGWQIARIKQKHRALEHALANQLHGKIQGALSATYLKLAAALKEGDISSLSLKDLGDGLVHKILGLGDTSGRPLQLDEAIDETKRTWANVCEVWVEVPAKLREMIYLDPLLCHAIEDLLPELAFNAVKHGKARNFKLALELTSDKTVRLTAQDSGTVNDSSERNGIGSKLLDDCSIRWERSTLESGTTVIAELPLNLGLND